MGALKTEFAQAPTWALLMAGVGATQPSSVGRRSLAAAKRGLAIAYGQARVKQGESLQNQKLTQSRRACGLVLTSPTRGSFMVVRVKPCSAPEPPSFSMNQFGASMAFACAMRVMRAVFAMEALMWVPTLQTFRVMSQMVWLKE